MNAKGEVKLADFGLARTFSKESKSYSQNVVTLWYRAPELLVSSENYNQSIDMWSVGCIFFEILTRKVLFRGTCVNSQLISIFRILGIPSASDFPLITSIVFENKLDDYVPFESFLKTHGFNILEIDLIKKLLCFDQQKRINTSQALLHPYFDSLT